MPIRNPVKLAGINRLSMNRGSAAGTTWGTPNSGHGSDMIGMAVNSDPYQTEVVSRLPVGQAKTPTITMTAPPANVSINTSPGKPPRSARGNQYS